MENSLLSTVALPLALAFIMFGLGLHLQPADFRRVGAQPRAVLVGLVCQMVLLPACAYGLAHLFNVPGHLAVGMMLLAASPGGTTANLFSYLFKGDVALNITLTAINSLLVVVSIPLIVGFSLAAFMGTQPYIPLQWHKTLEVLALVLIPVAIGMGVRQRWTGWAAKLDRPVKALSALILVLLTVLILVRERANLVSFVEQVGLACLVFNLLSLAVGYLAGRLTRLNEAQSRAIAFEVGVHNTTLAMYLALAVLQDGRMAIAPAVYSILMYITAALFGLWLGRGEVTPSPAANRAAARTR